MGYSKDIYDEVQKKLYFMRVKSFEKLEQRKKVFYERFPKAREIHKIIASTALESARAVLKGSDPKNELLRLKERNLRLNSEVNDMLKSVGLAEDYLEVKYNCKKCLDEGFVDGIMCDCMKDMLKKESYKKLNSMSPLELSSFEKFSLDYYPDIPIADGQQSPRKRMEIIFNICKKYAQDFTKNSPSLVLMGNTGLGKTHLSLAIASKVIDKGYGVIYISTQNMISSLEKEKFQNYREDTETERHFIDCDLLIIDDLGTEYATNFSGAAIYNIVNSRVMMNKPIIISTNLSTKELEKNYNQRMVSRIIGNNIRLEFLGFDIRQKRLLEKYAVNPR